MFNYAGWRNACNYIFIGFAAVFIVTRLIIFPFRYPYMPFPLIFTVALKLCVLSCRIIYCTWVYPVTIYEPFFGYYFFNGLLMVLQCLHIFWAVLIIRIAVRFLTSNVRNWRLTLNHHPSSLNIYESSFFFLRKKLTMREVTKMKRMNQKTRRMAKMIKSTWRKMGQCRTATQFTTITTARRSKRQQRITEGLISFSQGAGGRDGQTGGHHSSKPRTAGIKKMFATVTLTTQKHTHWLVPCQGTEIEQNSIRYNQGHGSCHFVLWEKEHFQSQRWQEGKECGHEGDDAASLLAFLVACLRAMPTMAGEIST